MLFKSSKIQYLAFSSSIASNICNVYWNSDVVIINPSRDVLDFGIDMFSNCSFELHNYQQYFLSA